MRITVTRELDTDIEQYTTPHSPTPRELKHLNPCEVEQHAHCPRRADIDEPDEPEEQLHVHARLRAHADFQQDNIECVERGGEEGEEVAEERV